MDKGGGDSHNPFDGDYDTTVIADTDKLALHPLEKPPGDTHTGTLADVQLRRFEIKQGFIIIRRDSHEITHLGIRNDDGTMIFTIHNVTDRKRGAPALFDGIDTTTRGTDKNQIMNCGNKLTNPTLVFIWYIRSAWG